MFFVLVAALSAPFWLVGSLTAWQPLPGVPASALMFVCPCAAALLLVLGESGPAGARDWLGRAVALRRASRLYGLALVLPPLAMLVAYGAMRVLQLPLPRVEMDFHRLPLVLVAFMVTASFEQIGWSAYAVDALQARHSALTASLLVGVAWALWHVVPLQQAGRTTDWIAWWCLATIALRILLTWLYDSGGGSVLAAALCQASMNTSWQYFPNHGSHYDPKIAGLVLLGVAVVVVMRYGPRTLDSSTRS